MGNYLLLYSTIYIICRVAACGRGGVEGKDNRRGELEAVIADVLIVLGEDLKFVNGRLTETLGASELISTNTPHWWSTLPHSHQPPTP